MIKDYVSLLRPHQYLKNLFIFLPLFFTIQITNLHLLGSATIAFIAFNLVSSSIYIFNDIKDIEEDKNHPWKKHRPLASGKVSPEFAAAIMLVLVIIGMGIAYFLNPGLLKVLGIYFTLNILYSMGLKHIAILDIFIIAAGFVLRLFAGAFVTGITLTMWIVIMTFLLALFLALAKRRDDVSLLATGTRTRRNIDGYNLLFIDISMAMMASVIIVSYIFYTISPEITIKFHTNYLYLTTLFVILGIMRYMQITFVEKRSGSPTIILLKDNFLKLIILGWLLLFVILIY